MARPKCPNHGCEMQYSGSPRIYICPVSNARFECDADGQETEMKIDKFGKPMVQYKVTPLDGDGG